MNLCKLKELKICNFKSYKGLSKITDFKQFTVIIGPNGCGKSNFMEAIAFGLGDNWQNFRVNSSLELIYCDELNIQKSSCFVELSFRLDNGDVKVFKRTLLINSQDCKFELDGSNVSSDDYKAALKSIGILDLGKNCLVYQDDIQSITTQDPKARCRLFERMSGSHNLEHDYNVAKRKYEKVKQKEKLIFDELKKMKTDVNILSKEEKQLIEYENLRKEERELIKNEQLFFLYHAEHDLKKLEDAIIEEEEERTNLSQTKSEMKRALNNSKENIENRKVLLNEYENKIQDKEKLAHEERETLKVNEEEIDLFKNKIEEVKKDCINFEKRCMNKKENILELNRHMKLMIDELNNLNDLVTLSPRQLNEEQYEEYFQLKKEAVNKTSIYSYEIEKEGEILDEYRYRLENEMRKKNDIKRKIDFRLKQYQSLQDGINNIKKNLINFQESLDEKEKLRDNLLEELNDNEKSSQNLTVKLETIVEQLKTMDMSEELLKEEREKLEILNEMKNNVNGIVNGRLITLCKPRNPRYKTALSKIFHKNAHAIVIDTMETVEECIKFLQNRNCSFEAFIPLDSIRVKSRKQKFGTIENAHYAFDLIEFPPEIERAVNFATENILVCENIETAKKLSSSEQKFPHTCVSLDGTMFRNDGFISGGASIDKLAKSFNVQNFENLKLQREQVMKELKAASNIELKNFEIKSLETEINSLRKQISFIEEQLRNEIKFMETKKTELNNLKEESKEISSAIEQIKDELSSKKTVINVKRQKIHEIEDEVFAEFCKIVGFENIRIFEEGDTNFQEKQDKIKEIRDHITRINEEIKIEESQDYDYEIQKCKTIEREMKTKLNENIRINEKMKGNLMEFENEIKNIQNDAEKLNADIQERLNKNQHHNQLIRKKTQEIKKMQENIKKMKNDKLIIKNAMIEILMDCRSNAINIALLSGNLNEYLEEDSENTIEIDYSTLKDEYKMEENKVDASKEFGEKLYEIRFKLENCIIPNEKNSEMLKEAKQKLLRLKRKLNEEKKANEKLHKTFEDIKVKRRNLFESFFNKVNGKIDSIYKNLTQSDAAQALLIIENSEEPYLSGLIYNCIVPGKKYMSVEGLSGGEKTIAGFTLILAIQKANQAPFMFLDEMEAALDLINVNKIADYVEKEDKQFILITHKAELSSKASAIIGVTKKGKFSTDSCLFTVDLQKYQG